jgi:hypothetical protein
MAGNSRVDRLNPYDLSSVATVRKDLRLIEKKITSPKPFNLSESVTPVPSDSEEGNRKNAK